MKNSSLNEATEINLDKSVMNKAKRSIDRMFEEESK